MSYEHTKLPAQVARITVNADGSLDVPGRPIISAEVRLRHIHWTEAADLIIKGVANTIAAKELTYDLARRRNVEEVMQRLIPGATLKSCAGFGDAIIQRMAD
jgi:isocitrate dehydrogenase